MLLSPAYAFAPDPIPAHSSSPAPAPSPASAPVPAPPDIHVVAHLSTISCSQLSDPKSEINYFQ